MLSIPFVVVCLTWQCVTHPRAGRRERPVGRADLPLTSDELRPASTPGGTTDSPPRAVVESRVQHD
ncbi:hypothetical protein HBB16_11950 [Pseudonocardia sp. MCCB 268]|nr:hypothetical protein [Pseudonocardia cytotoxica]